MIVCPPIAIVYIGSYYAVNMIHGIKIWVHLLLILGVLYSGNCAHFMVLYSFLYRPNIEMGASTL
jgi:hypothetical protein